MKHVTPFTTDKPLRRTSIYLLGQDKLRAVVSTQSTSRLSGHWKILVEFENQITHASS